MKEEAKKRKVEGEKEKKDRKKYTQNKWTMKTMFGEPA